MADVDSQNDNDVNLLKSTRIQVFVDEALPDILVVSFEFGVKLFKGVLLDTNKKHIPCGVANLNPAFESKDDPLYSANQRFAYVEPSSAPPNKKKNVQLSSAKYNKSKLAVRLRPRQVLCSKCKGICNENSENVTNKKRKASPQPSAVQPSNLLTKRAANAPITRSVKKYDETDLIVLGGNINKLNIDNNKKPLANHCSNEEQQHSFEHSNASTSDCQKLKRMLRKKKSLGSMEDLWDEGVFEESKRVNNNEQTMTGGNTRTIKICYGSQGEGTVLKIPAQIENADDGELEENINVDNDKAARKAMKKAKKEAKRKILHCNSPDRSPKYSIGSSSPRYTVGSASPRHGLLGNNSPRYNLEVLTPKKRKHKVKHKKRHKDEKDRKYSKDGDDSAVIASDLAPISSSTMEPYVPQKLSINLKRLSTTYANCDSSCRADESSSDEQPNEQIPNFPPSSNQSLMMMINGPAMKSAPAADGGCVVVGDVVWGKIHGFPWWPGKVLTITNCGSNVGPQAHVAWYGSSTSSLLQCDQLCPYLEHFKIRYNKKKRGPYKEAIKQATTEAKLHAERKMKENLVQHSPARTIIPIVPPALASPREIDVLS